MLPERAVPALESSVRFAGQLQLKGKKQGFVTHTVPEAPIAILTGPSNPPPVYPPGPERTAPELESSVTLLPK
jgi:hypothetical protein